MRISRADPLRVSARTALWRPGRSAFSLTENIFQLKIFFVFLIFKFNGSKRQPVVKKLEAETIRPPRPWQPIPPAGKGCRAAFSGDATNHRSAAAMVYNQG
jgi:hypothetical protein